MGWFSSQNQTLEGGDLGQHSHLGKSSRTWLHSCSIGFLLTDHRLLPLGIMSAFQKKTKGYLQGQKIKDEPFKKFV